MGINKQCVVFHLDDYGRLLQKKMVNHYEYGKTETEATEKFVDYITDKKPMFALLHLDHVDHAGHEKDYNVKQPVYQYDVTATVAFISGLEVPYSWTSRTVKAAFFGFS